MVLRKRSLTREYKLGARIAAGGMSELYEGTAENGDPVAIKRLWVPSQETEVVSSGFVREATILASMDHPNIVELIDVGEDEEDYFLIMEMIVGISLADIIKVLNSTDEIIETDLACGILGQIARGLGHAHERQMPDGDSLGIIHRDLAPENILIDQNGVPKLIDFGIATLNGFEITNPGVIRGHPRYLSPEQARAESIDVRSDIFALGAVLFELLAGEPLYQETAEAALLWKVQKGEYPSVQDRLRSRDPALIDIVARSVATHPGDRYRNARELERDLDRFRAAREMRIDHNTIAATVEAVSQSRLCKKAKKATRGKGHLTGHLLTLKPDQPQRSGSFSNPALQGLSDPQKRDERANRWQRPSDPQLERPPELQLPTSPMRMNSVRAKQLIKERWQIALLVSVGILGIITVVFIYGATSSP